MTQQIAQVSVRILDKEYQVACPAEERTDLLDSAELFADTVAEVPQVALGAQIGERQDSQ